MRQVVTMNLASQVQADLESEPEATVEVAITPGFISPKAEVADVGRVTCVGVPGKQGVVCRQNDNEVAYRQVAVCHFLPLLRNGHDRVK